MRLETKLGISTGVLIFAMFGTALTTHLRLTGVIRTARDQNDGRRPLIGTLLRTRGDLSESLVTLQSSLLIKSPQADRASSRRTESTGERPLDPDLYRLLHPNRDMDLGPDAQRVQALVHQIVEIGRMERTIEALNPGTGEVPERALMLLQHELLPLNDQAQQTISQIVKTESDRIDREVATLIHEDILILVTLWLATG